MFYNMLTECLLKKKFTSVSIFPLHLHHECNWDTGYVKLEIHIMIRTCLMSSL